MKILYLITKSESGGAQTHVVRLCGYFKSRGDDVAVMAYPGGWLENEVKKIGGTFFSNHFFSNSINPILAWKAVREVRRIVKNFKPRIVHCHSSGAGVFGRLAVRDKIKTIYTAHGWGFNVGVPFIQKWIAIIMEKFLSRYCDKIICVSQFVKDLALKNKIAPEEKLKVIYNGVEDYGFRDIRQNNKVRIIFVGRLEDPKEPILLLKAINGLQNIVLDIIGEGSKRQDLENYIQTTSMVNVNLRGELDRVEIIKLLKQSDIFVLISKWEGLPITILEAMSCALPVIASDVGGIKEAVDNRSGILVHSVEELKDVLQKLAKNSALRIKMGMSGREKVRIVFSEFEMFKNIEKIYFNK